MAAGAAHIASCESYLRSRTGCYEYRRIRYNAVIEKMREHGLTNDDLVLDVGAGWTEFDYCLRTEHNFRGRYWPVDGMLDGVDLNHWKPKRRVDFTAAIEVVEHVRDPWGLMTRLTARTDKLVIVTTPNPATTDVLGMDPTHVSMVSRLEFHDFGWNVEVRSFYGQKNDSLLAWRGRK